MLSENVRRRKRLLERELSAAGIASDCGSGSNSRRTSRRRSRSPPPSSSEHRRSTHDSWRQPQQRSDTRGRSRSRELRRRLEARRNRHASQSPPPSRRRRSSGGGGGRSSVGISFLDELERTFAEQGKEFPEKELLLQQQWLKNGQPKHPAAKRSRLQSPSRNRTVLLGTPTMMQQPMNAMPPAHFMMPNPAFQPPQQQQQPYQSMYQQPYSNLMAAANAIVPPQQQIPLQSPGYANTYGSSSHASYAGHPNSLLPTPMLNMQLPPADSIPITVIPDLSPESDVPPASVRVKLRGKPFPTRRDATPTIMAQCKCPIIFSLTTEQIRHPTAASSRQSNTQNTVHLHQHHVCHGRRGQPEEQPKHGTHMQSQECHVRVHQQRHRGAGRSVCGHAIHQPGHRSQPAARSAAAHHYRAGLQQCRPGCGHPPQIAGKSRVR